MLNLKTFGLGTALASVTIIITSVSSLQAFAATVSGTSLQNLFNTTISPGTIDVNADQDPTEVWTNNAGTPNATILLELANNANLNSFGIYKQNDKNLRAQLFSGLNSTGITGRVTISFFDDSSILVTPLVGSSVLINNFGNNFGYYLDGPGGLFFSQDNLNGGAEQMLAYQGKNNLTLDPPFFAAGSFDENDYILAWEDKPFALADRDYNDFVVLVSDVKPVPEPITMLGAGTALGFGAFFKRQASRQQNKDNKNV